VFQLEKNTFIYWPFECTLKAWIRMLFQLERTISIYWPIENTPKIWFRRVLELAKILYIYWAIECTPKAWFVKVFQLERTTFIYWAIECTPNFDLLRCSNLKELASSIGQLNALQKLDFKGCHVHCLGTNVICMFILFKQGCCMSICIVYTRKLCTQLVCVNNAWHSCLNDINPWNNKFYTDLEQTHEIYKYVMLRRGMEPCPI
jgi:hypothetical protein